MSNIIFRLSTKLKGFETFEETQKFFLNILPNRDNSYFFNTKRFNKIKPK
ncbi:hypothetical protein Sdiek1_0559 [Sulfurospirillum diekertiae]|uniref:Uncharacterized protein n=1 Tax=Sulfurospirillum diekertiae TaxID=1854492 RepID=A0A1Y0HK63_9BACT|nr:hypothetical protein Sdiek1_0559 [Sulfurospirillum diekertiae]